MVPHKSPNICVYSQVVSNMVYCMEHAYTVHNISDDSDGVYTAIDKVPRSFRRLRGTDESSMYVRKT